MTVHQYCGAMERQARAGFDEVGLPWTRLKVLSVFIVVSPLKPGGQWLRDKASCVATVRADKEALLAFSSCGRQGWVKGQPRIV